MENSFNANSIANTMMTNIHDDKIQEWHDPLCDNEGESLYRYMARTQHSQSRRKTFESFGYLLLANIHMPYVRKSF